MNRATSHRSPTYRSTGLSDLYMLLALLGMPMIVLLYWLLQNSNPNWFADLTAGFQSRTNPSAQTNRSGSVNTLKPGQMTTLPDGRKAKVLAITHIAVCEPGRDSLNIRPKSSFDAPIARIPCGSGVAVTGPPVSNQGENWSPVVYGTTQGWSVTRLLRKI
jgi:hypothetical protein